MEVVLVAVGDRPARGNNNRHGHTRYTLFLGRFFLSSVYGIIGFENIFETIVVDLSVRGVDKYEICFGVTAIENTLRSE